MEDWCTIESDPGVFTELIKEIGVKGVQFEEVYSIDMVDDLKPVYGLIFLFKFTENQKESSPLEDYDPTLFFANQVIQNACATQAILSLLLNCPEVELGQTLTDFKEFTMPLDPQTRGYSLTNSEAIRKAHNSFSRQEAFEYMGKRKATEDDEVYHFIGYVPFNGHLYELDGIQKGPIMHADCSGEDWLEKVKPIIMERIAQYAATEIRFNLLALVQDKGEAAEAEIEKLSSQKAAIIGKLVSLGVELDVEMDAALDEDFFATLPDSAEALQAELVTKTDQISLQQTIATEENARKQKWREENARRKHNYIPFIQALLETLAKKDMLLPLYEKAKTVKEAKDKEAAAS